ncbi:hypothetical protein GCM10028773_48380 [Spirosoma koreense]
MAYSALFSFLFLTAYIGKPPLAMSQNPQAVIASQEARRGPADSFTGVVWVKTLVPANDQTDCIVSEVTFDPTGRTFWHTHPNGQILIVTQGTGYYQEQGKPIQVIRPGESVNIAPNVVHWHGAGPDDRLTHIAINPNVSKGGAVNWLQPVTDGEYSRK